MTVDTVEREFADFDWGKVEFMPKSHRYALHIKAEELFEDHDGELKRVPAISVTSAIGILDKPALRKWYGAEDALAVLEMERAGELVGIPDDQAIYVARSKGRGAEAKRDAGAERGNAVHLALRGYCESGVVPSLSGLPDSTRPYVQALCSWLLDASPEPLMVEQIVGSPTHGFAGRFDLLATIDGTLCLIDAKTSSGAHKYPEASLQMAGYELAFPECGIAPPERSLILTLTDSGLYEVGEAKGKAEDFLAVLAAQKAVSGLRNALRAQEKAK